MEQILKSCRCCLNKLINSQVSLSNSAFKEMCTSVATLISYFPTSIKSKYENARECFNYRYLLIFQFSQLISALQLLVDVIANECKINFILKDCRNSLYKRINFCLDKISMTFNSGNELTNMSGCFLRWMDNALEKLREVDIDNGKKNGNKELQEATALFEDVLSHAMSIAQICLSGDSKAIKGSSQCVLEALEGLKDELNKYEPNKAMVSLFIDICGDKLCSLERKVDIAVLKLSLNVFSQYLLPLEEIFKFCEVNSGDVFDQQVFDNIVADFDLHVDRIMQIGLFAVFCSSNVKSGIKIRSCMASLEYLELELVPVTRMLLSEGSEVNRTSALIFKNYWINQAIKLKTEIFEIIDPFAFSQVINDVVNEQLDILLERYKNKKDFSKCLFENIVRCGTVLTDFLLTAVRNEDIIIINEPPLKDNVKKCCVVMKEITRAVEVLDDNSCETNDKIFKRCRVFKAQSKKLQLLFMKGDLKEIEGKDRSFVIEEEKNISENKFLKHIIESGKNMLDNRSILYRSSSGSLSFKLSNHLKSGNRKTVDATMKKQKLNFSFDSSHNNQSFEVHITEILDKLSNLSSNQ